MVSDTVLIVLCIISFLLGVYARHKADNIYDRIRYGRKTN